MADPPRTYPDISEIIARKEAGRRARGHLSFAEKLAALDALRERIAPIMVGGRARKMEIMPPKKKGR